MKTFIVTETRPATAIWEYYVEAESEEQAKSLVQDGKVDPIESDIEHFVDIDYDEVQYEARLDTEEA